MELEHSFKIPVPVEKAWPVLLDVQQIAPCMPGAAVESVDGDDFTGSVKVKLGPINLTYKGQASFVEKDETAHRAVIDARGRDSRGNGTASAKITATLTAAGDETEVKVVTDLNITGKPAQFGRGVMADVGNKLIGQFADCLADKLGGDSDTKQSDAGTGAATTAAGDQDKTPTGSVPVITPEVAVADKDKADAAQNDVATVPAGSQSPAPTPAPPAPPAPKPTPRPAEPEPIDLIELAGGSVAKKAAPVAVALLVALLLAIILGKKKKKK